MYAPGVWRPCAPRLTAAEPASLIASAKRTRLLSTCLLRHKKQFWFSPLSLWTCFQWLEPAEFPAPPSTWFPHSTLCHHNGLTAYLDLTTHTHTHKRIATCKYLQLTWLKTVQTRSTLFHRSAWQVFVTRSIFKSFFLKRDMLVIVRELRWIALISLLFQSIWMVVAQQHCCGVVRAPGLPRWLAFGENDQVRPGSRSVTCEGLSHERYLPKSDGITAADSEIPVCST